MVQLIACTLFLVAAAWVGAAEVCPSAWPGQHVQRHQAERRENVDAQGHPLYQLDVYQDALFDDTYQVSLEAHGTAHPMRSFIAVTEAFGLNAASCGKGSFLAPNVAVGRGRECSHVLVDAGGQQKTSAIFRWTPPTCGCVKLRATVIAVTQEFYTDPDNMESGPLTKTICVEEEDPDNDINVFGNEDDLENDFNIEDPLEELLDESEENEDKMDETTGDSSVQVVEEDDEEETEEDGGLTTPEPTEEVEVEEEEEGGQPWVGRKQQRLRRKHARQAKKQAKRKAKKAKKLVRKNKWRKVLKVLKQKKQKMHKARVGKKEMIKRIVKRMKHVKKAKGRFRRQSERNMTQICTSVRNLPNEPHRRFRKKWHKMNETERSATWTRKVAVAKACCDKQTEDAQRRCFLELKRQRIDDFCSGQTRLTPLKPGNKNTQNIKELCCRRADEEKYNCFNRSSDSFWRKEIRKNKVYSAKKVENICKKMRRHDDPHKRFMVKWRQQLPARTDRVQLWEKKRSQIMQCCAITDAGNKSRCMLELRRQRLDSLCSADDEASHLLPMTSEQLHQLRTSCCAKQGDERYSCMWQLKSQQPKRKWRRKHAHKKGPKRQWWKTRDDTGEEADVPEDWDGDRTVDREEAPEEADAGDQDEDDVVEEAETEVSCCDAGKTMAEMFRRKTKANWRRRKCARKAVKFAQFTQPNAQRECQEEYQRCCQSN